jgi:hypothetical protein
MIYFTRITIDKWWGTNSASIEDLAKIDLRDLKLCPSG